MVKICPPKLWKWLHVSSLDETSGQVINNETVIKTNSYINYKPMKPLFFLLSILSLLFSSCMKQDVLVTYNSDHLSIGIDSKGFVQSLTDKSTGTNYLSTDTIAPLLSCRVESEIIFPVSAVVENEHLIFNFKDDLNAKVRVEEKPTHITFELLELTGPEEVELIIWGPVPTTIHKIIGETVGVVRGEEFALGIQSLNPKTLGGFTWMDNDCMPQFDIFEQDDYSDLSPENKGYTLYRVEAAKPEKFGSTLQAYCRNRFEERVISNMNHEKYISPVFEDGGVVGSKIALFGCPVEETLETIGKIELAENLPHPMIDGEWGKQTVAAAAAYLIFDFGEKNIDEAIEYTQKAGLRYLYHPDPFKNWGHFQLKEDRFPNGRDGLKQCVEKAEAQGIHVGLHTLSNFITTNDSYVTPVPDARLAKVGTSVLSEAIDAVQTDITIESPDFFNQYNNNNLHTVIIGDELIRYKTVSDSAPWRLTGCERGAWGTKASNHKAGEKVGKLADHGYKVFLSDPDLSIEMAETLADLFNYCGLRQISFDGLEGNQSTGMGNYGEILFAKTWWDGLSEDIKKHAIIDASRTSHYFWHIYSRMNWGEPWYAGFRESQTEYRLKNQAYFQRNLMPAMLGWFSMRENTPVEDIEWMLARSAGFDAGYALVTNKQRLEANGQSAEILELIGRWEKARMAGAFSEDQKERMKDIQNEFHLEANAEVQWVLYPVATFKFKHQDRVKQPGEPLFSTFKFENPVENAPMNFIITAKDATISDIEMEVNNSRRLTFPVKLKSGESIRYKGDGKAIILDNNLQKKGELEIDASAFKLGKGPQSITFDCNFVDKKDEAVAAFEVRISGEGEEVVAR